MYDAFHAPPFGSLADNVLCGVNEYGDGKYTTEGINALCDAVKSTTTLTSLKYASQLESLSPLTAFNVLCPPVARSLANNEVCGLDRYGRGTYTAQGINAL